MLILRNIKISVSADFNDLSKLFEEITHISSREISDISLYKRSIDARRKDDIRYVCSFLINAKNEKQMLHKLKRFDASVYSEQKYIYPSVKSEERPIVIGFGPAGIFASLALAKAGLRPIIYERGKDVDSRKKDVDLFFEGGTLNEESNIQFGEGGAGTFSDGKLNTGTHDYRIREVLEVFYKHGADKNILFDAKPHIGTDILINVVKSLRNEIISLGGEIHFEHKLIGINTKNERVSEIIIENNSKPFTVKCNQLVLAIGHSARDTFNLLKNSNIKMQPKAFAIGLRIEHKQAMINQSQFGDSSESSKLGAADYKLSCHLENGRSVFSFCMCPGGIVVNASSENGGVVTNGMSYQARNYENANSAVLVGINVEDYYKGDVLDGVEFQRKIEQKAFKCGNGKPVSQIFADFVNNEPTKEVGSVNPSILPNAEYGNINEILPSYVCESLKEGIKRFDTKIKGFSSEDAVLTAPETRSSSPVRILRNDEGHSSAYGIFPCGEGAGYAGGITSSAVDGLKTAEKVIEFIKKK